MSKTCCDFGCNQGRDCPARAFPVTTGCSLKAPPKPIEPPPVDRKDRVLHLAEWLALTAAILFTAAASAGFFTQ